MKTTSAFQKNLHALLAVHGNYSRIAKALEVDPRHLRRNRVEPSRKLQKAIADRSRILRLREFIKLVREETGLTDKGVRDLMRRANERSSECPSPYEVPE